MCKFYAFHYTNTVRSKGLNVLITLPPPSLLLFSVVLNNFIYFVFYRLKYDYLSDDEGEPEYFKDDKELPNHCVMIGPLLVHQQMNFASFNYFSCSLLGFDKCLRHVMAFGTDGNSALVDSLSHSLPFAIQLRCNLKSMGHPTGAIYKSVY